MFGSKKLFEKGERLSSNGLRPLVILLEAVTLSQTLKAKRDARILASEFHSLLNGNGKGRGSLGITLLLQHLQACVVLRPPVFFIPGRASKQEKHPSQLLDGAYLAGLQSCERILKFLS